MRPQSRRTLILLLLLLSILAGCGAAKKDASSPAVVVVLLDMTSSTAEDANRYMGNVTEVLNSLQGGDKIYIVPFAGTYPPEILITRSLPAATFNAVQDASEMKAIRQEVQLKVAQVLQSLRPSQKGTAVLGAIRKASAILAQESGSPHTVVILSDMLEQTDIDFFSQPPTEPAPLLDRLEKERFLPKLEAQVYVAGISPGKPDGQQLTQKQMTVIEEFWQAYFERVGARLATYDRDLLNFTIRR